MASGYGLHGLPSPCHEWFAKLAVCQADQPASAACGQFADEYLTCLSDRKMGVKSQKQELTLRAVKELEAQKAAAAAATTAAK